MELHYWKIRGLGEPIRMMLEHLGVSYENKYKTSFEDWFHEKINSDIELVNLPYLVDGETKLTQSYAIMRYLARKYKKLLPSGEIEQQRVDQAEGVLVDLRFSFAMLCYNPEFEKMKDSFLKDLPNKLAGLEKVFGKRTWAVGTNLTYIDFGICEILDHMELCFPGCYSNLPNIKKYKTAFNNLESIKKYKSSDKFFEMPVYSPLAFWGK